jgi:glycosyltransferase involved in cell wall biosynthesis
MTPLLSVIMPTYNGEEFIATALASVRDQQDERIEVVIVDDGSSDRTLDIVRRFEDVLTVRLITPGRVGNWVAVTNLGLREAAGDWLCLLHQDDFWLPGRMKRLRDEMASCDVSLIVHDALYVGPDGRCLGPWTCPLPEGRVPSDLFVERLLIQNFIAIPSPVFRRNAALNSGGLDEGLWFSADWDLWLRLGALGPVRFIAEQLSAFRIHPESQTASRKLQANEWEQQLTAVLELHLKRWPGQGRVRTAVERVASASIQVNSVLAAASRGEAFRPAAVLGQLLALGPSGWHRYFRDSRIVQRVGSRLRVR